MLSRIILKNIFQMQTVINTVHSIS